MAKKPETNGDASALATTTIAVGTKETKLKFEFPRQYTEGHVLSAIEATQLDRTRAENIANNLRKIVQSTILGEEGALSEDALREKVTIYAESYEFSLVGTGAGALTTLERTAQRIARSAIVDKMRLENGLLVKDMTDEQKLRLDEYVVEISERDAIIELAEAEIVAKANAAEAVLSGLNLDDL